MSDVQNYIIEHPTAIVVAFTVLVILLLLAVGNGFKHSGMALELQDRLESAQFTQQELEHEREIERAENEARLVAARREFSGYKEAVRHLTAHPTTVIVSDKQQSGFTAREFDEFHNGNFAHDVRAAARNGEPI